MKLTIQIVNFRSRHYLRECLFSISENLPAGVGNGNFGCEQRRGAAGRNCATSGKTSSISESASLEKMSALEGRIMPASDGRGASIFYCSILIRKFFPVPCRGCWTVFDKDQRIGIVGPLFVDSAGEIQLNCFGTQRTPFSTIGKKIFGRGKPSAGEDEIFETDWVSGGAMMVRRNVFEKIGGFDERYFMYFEDVDLCLRAKKLGYKVAVNPKVRIFHESGKSFASEAGKEKTLLCFAGLLYAETFRANRGRPCETAASSILCEECLF